MSELILEYTNESGERSRIPLTSDKSIIGRHSESEVCIPDQRLSRRHLQIDRFGDVFIASDAGSSNGSKLNGIELTEPTALKEGDVLDLGGLTVNVLFEGSDTASSPWSSYSDDDSAHSAANVGSGSVGQAGGSTSSDVTTSSAAARSNSMLLWIIIPVFGIVFIFFAGAILFLVLSGPTTAAKKTDPLYTEDDFYNEPDNKNDSKKDADDDPPSNSKTLDSNSNSGGDIPISNSSQTGKLSETAKIEHNGGAFLRLIAQKDPRAFLTTEQASKVSTKIKQYSGSSAVAENLKSANKSASQIKALAEQKGVRPQFLAIAAVAKLGNSRGDVYKTAESMASVLGELNRTIGTELAEDAVLVIAAYGQGTAGEFLKMRNMLQDLANKSSESARTIRTIWYLQKNSKITQSEYENALIFLAIGTISQNPKDFGVNAEALTL